MPGRDVQPLKAFSPIIPMVFANSTVLRLVQPEKASSAISVTPLFSLIVLREVLLVNTCFGMLDCVSTVSNAVQPEKAAVPMELTWLPM